jgi:hypothetical protein
LDIFRILLMLLYSSVINNSNLHTKIIMIIIIIIIIILNRNIPVHKLYIYIYCHYSSVLCCAGRGPTMGSPRIYTNCRTHLSEFTQSRSRAELAINKAWGVLYPIFSDVRDSHALLRIVWQHLTISTGYERGQCQSFLETPRKLPCGQPSFDLLLRFLKKIYINQVVTALTRFICTN